MSNEALFGAVIATDLALVLVAWKAGPRWVVAAIIINLLLSNTFASKLIPIFGVTTSVSVTFYAAIFAATDILTEHHGRRMGFHSIAMAFVGLVVFVVMGQFVLAFSPAGEAEGVHTAMGNVFGLAPRLAAAGLIAYAASQGFDVWCFHDLKERTNSKYLVLRNNASTIVSQGIDSVLFYGLAFVGTMPGATLLSVLVTAWAVKVGIALLDTPIVYLSYGIRGDWGYVRKDIGDTLETIGIGTTWFEDAV